MTTDKNEKPHQPNDEPNMANNIVEEHLQSLAEDWQSDPDFSRCVFAEIELRQVEPKRKKTSFRKLKVNTMIKVSCASLLVIFTVVAGFVYFINSDSASAKIALPSIREAMQEEDAMYIIRKSYGADGEKIDNEAWYVKGVGYASRGDGFAYVDNGTSCWTYSEEKGYTTRFRSLGLDKYFKDKVFPESRYERLESEDVVTNGKKLKCYRIRSAARVPDNSHRSLVYVDSSNRYVKIKSMKLEDEKWIVKSESFYEYDAAVDHSVFEPVFKKQLPIVDYEAELNSAADPEKNLLTKKIMDATFAVHRLQPLEGGGLFVVTSLRDDGWYHHIQQFRMYMPPLSRKTNDGLKITLGTANHWGILVKWYLLLPRNNEQDWAALTEGHTNFSDWVYIDEADPESRRYEYLFHSKNEIKVKLDISKQLPISLESVCKQVYQDQTKMKHVLARLDMGWEPDTGRGLTVKSEDTTEAEYFDAVKRHIVYEQLKKD